MTTSVLVLLLLLSISASFVFGGALDSKYELHADYVTVNEEHGSNIFYYLYKVPDVEMKRNKPIVFWLQGGPGASSVLGDLCEIGPVDLCEEAYREVPRNYTWMNDANALVFIDQPVGTGFSYVKDSKGYATSEEDIVTHATIVVKQIYSKFPSFHGVPLYIFSESYGGKMNANIGLGLYKQRNSINGLNLAGIALGDSWIAPEIIVNSYGEYLYQLSHLDANQKAAVNSYGQKVSQAIKQGNWGSATDIWGSQQEYISDATAGISFYNFLRHSEYTYDNMTKYVNTEFRKKLNNAMPPGKSIPDHVVWTLEAGSVFNYLSNDFMKPAISQVEELLNSGVKVIVYNGQLDVIVPTPAIFEWIDQLTGWKGLSGWQSAQSLTIQPRPPTPQDTSGLIGVTNIAFRKRYQNLDLWRVLFSGHMVPQDNSFIASEMFKRITDEALDKEKTQMELQLNRLPRNRRKQWKP